METLHQIWQRLKDNGYETDKGSVHSYLEVYEELLKPYRKMNGVSVLEIGLFNGCSIRMWDEYFNSFNASVHGIDCSLTPHGGLGDLRPIISEEKYHIHILDATGKEEIAKYFALYDINGGELFDVIIEDAGHHIDQQVELYNIWKDYLAPGGIYIIEDIQDIDRHKGLFAAIGGEVIDRRHIKNRYDDVLVILKS